MEYSPVPNQSDAFAAPHPSTPQEALELLLEGNRRHQEGRLELHDHSPVADERAERQMPFAAIVSCADSRRCGLRPGDGRRLGSLARHLKMPVCPSEYRPGCGYTQRPCGPLPTGI
ncbi:MAG TPA: hypothetical protein VFY30_09360, partial [Solirubrobacterales bacterium]|nr:hypothetical protein [Solirubrobacterales bacterium]